MRSALLVAVLCASFSGAGCAKEAPPAATAAAKKPKVVAKECDAIVGVINRAFRRVESAAKPSGSRDEIAQLNEMSDALGSAATDVEATTVTDPQLYEVRRQYASFARAVGRAAKELAEAASARDEEAINVCRQRLNVLTQEEDPIFDRLNAVCR